MDICPKGVLRGTYWQRVASKHGLGHGVPKLIVSPQAPFERGLPLLGLLLAALALVALRGLAYGLGVLGLLLGGFRHGGSP